jgi:hypothetical protein
MRKPDYGTATAEEIINGSKIASDIAGHIKSLPNPALQNMVKQLLDLIYVDPGDKR